MTVNINWKPSPNYTAGRGGRKIIAIVNHQTGGQGPGALSWLSNPASKVSAHYLIFRDGTVYQLVRLQDTAWQAGAVDQPSWMLYDGTNPNRYTLGIEHECYPAVGGDGNLTERQYHATLELHRQLISNHSIVADRTHIIGHYQLDSVNRSNCPGRNFPWERLMQDLTLGTTSVPIVTSPKKLMGFVINGVSYAPVRALANQLGRTVEWDALRNAVLIPPVTVAVPTAQADKVFVVTGAVVIEGLLLGGTSYALARTLAEALGYQAEWDDANKTVIIL
ncbi:MAG TPA: N-acetylmuramoyl-L-alanine amidase [Syntrophomonas sp.]|nr:N-acetylmuramoyl-L-alanine amidase [Syntrophomonas sp.]